MHRQKKTNSDQTNSNANRNTNSLNRREFFGLSAGILAGAAAFQFTRAAEAEESRRGGSAPAAGAGEPQFATPGKGMAVAVKYVEDTTKADAALKDKKSGIAPEKQSCKNCALYTPDKDAAKKYGECVVFKPTKELVKENAWCSSWALKKDKPSDKKM